MINIQLPEGIKTATKADLRRLAGITGEAFHDDPVSRWIFGDPRALAPMFRILADAIYLQHNMCHVAGDDAATMWCMSEANRNLSTLNMLRFIATVLPKASRGTLKRATDVGETMAREHPRDPHIYLFTIGTRQTARGKGFGKAMLAPVLEAADRAGLPAYLENSNPVNHSFYAAHGFERMQIFACDGKDGPALEAMWRKPKPIH